MVIWEYGNLGIWECGAWEYGNLNTCASVTRSLGDNLTQSIKKYGCFKNVENKAFQHKAIMEIFKGQ